MIANSPLVKAFWENGRVDDCPVIDMHGHMGPLAAIYFPRAEPQQMLQSMDNANVTRLVFSSHEALFSAGTGNDYTASIVRKWPDRFSGMMVINGNFMDIVESDLARFDAMRDAFIGFKFLPEYHKVAANDSRYDKVWAFANERKLLVTCHTWGHGQMNSPAEIRPVAEKYPEVRLAMAHSCYGMWEEAAQLSLDFPNVYCDLTAVFERRGALELFCERGISERMLFGTDLPWFSPLQGIGAVLSADINDEDRRNIFYRNARRLLKPLLSRDI